MQRINEICDEIVMWCDEINLEFEMEKLHLKMQSAYHKNACIELLEIEITNSITKCLKNLEVIAF